MSNVRERLDFACIQETMLSDAGSQDAIAKMWNGPSFWSPALGPRGVLRSFVRLVNVTTFRFGKKTLEDVSSVSWFL